MIKMILKFLFAGGIIYWLVQTDKLDFSLVNQVLDHHWLLAGCFSLLLFQASIASLRWSYLLKIEAKEHIPFFKVLKLTYIGLFFNTVLPGAVTGDLIKLVYAKDIDPSISKTYLVTSVLLDRIIGLVGLLSLLGVFSIINYSDLKEISPNLTNLVHFNFIVFAGMLSVLGTIFIPEKLQSIILRWTIKVPIIGSKINQTLMKVWQIGQNKVVVLKCYIISILTQMISVYAFWLLASPFYEVPLSLGYAFTFIPLGFVAISIPITPAGIGLGHAIFGTLFAYFSINNGASLFNLYLLIMFSNNILGLIPYVLSGKRHSLKDTTEFTTA
jgi:hypothetical protein